MSLEVVLASLFPEAIAELAGEPCVSRVRQVAHHRNGITGEGFYAVLFDDDENDLFLGIVFKGPGQCAVIRVADLSTPVGVTFGENSWRGGNFETALREAIKMSQGIRPDDRWGDD
jgi:hypothetical protein